MARSENLGGYMKNILGLGLFAVGAYVLYEVMQGKSVFGLPPLVGPSTNPTTTTQPISNTSTPVVVTTTPVASTNPVPAKTIKQRMFEASGNAPKLNADQWGYYYNNLMPPIPPSAFDALFIAPNGGSRDKLYSVDEWIYIVQSGGVTSTALGSWYDPSGFGGVDILYGGAGSNGLGWGWETTGPRSGYRPQASWYERNRQN